MALLIDGKDSNDDYDLIALLKNKYEIDLFPPESTTPGTIFQHSQSTPTLTTDQTTSPVEDSSNPSTVHTGFGYVGHTTGAGLAAGSIAKDDDEDEDEDDEINLKKKEKS